MDRLVATVLAVDAAREELPELIGMGVRGGGMDAGGSRVVYVFERRCEGMWKGIFAALPGICRAEGAKGRFARVVRMADAAVFAVRDDVVGVCDGMGT